MNRLTRFLDWLDDAAAGFIRLAYLLAGITAVALYFGAGHLPGFIEAPLNGALPWTLAAAVETHTYITARRVRAAWQEKAWTALKVNLGILAGLLAFSAWNQLNYLADTWQPPVGALALPAWLAYLIRALVVPAAFMAAAFLAPMAEPITAQIEAEARATLADVFKIARKQRRRMLKIAERDGRDMTGALVELVPDTETRRIISHAYGAIGAPVTSAQAVIAAPVIVEPTPAPAQTQSPPVESLPVAQFTPWELLPKEFQSAPVSPALPLPTGPGTPAKKPRKRRDVITPTNPHDTKVLQMPAPRKRTSRRKSASGRGPRLSVEQKARAAWRVGMSASELARTAHIGKSAASKYRTQFAIEAIQAEQKQAVQ